jgi:hypothetical protein
MLASLAFAWAGVANVALGQESPGGVFVSPRVKPIKLTADPVLLQQAVVDPTRIVPEGEPLPLLPPPQRQPIVDPVIQHSVPGTQLAGGPVIWRLIRGGIFDVTDLLTNPGVNVGGITTGAQPPDTTGDVGRSHFVQMVNATRFQIFDKSGNSLTGALNFGALFPAGTPGNANLGDPIVVYDHLADRWVLSQFGTTHLCFAISQTPDPTANTWFIYQFDVGDFPDYPKIGVWPDAYYVSSFESPNLGVYAFDRSNMINGNAAAFMKTTIPALGTANVRSTRILPADLDGAVPPPGTPGYFVRTVDGQQDAGNPTDRIEIYEAQVDWVGMTFSFPLVNTLTPAAFNVMLCDRNGSGVRDCIPQPNTTATVDALSNRPMMQLKYRNFGSFNAMVFNQTIDISGTIFPLFGFTPTNEVAGIRWYQLVKSGGGWSIGQQGTFAPQPLGTTAENQLLHRWMGSAGMDGLGNIGMGYSICNDNDANPVFPGIRYTGRRAEDAPGLMPQGEKTILNGTTSSGANGDFGRRWGDYSQIGVDPIDDCTFWYTTHDASGNTRIASFNLASATIVTIIADSGNFGEVCVGAFKDLPLTISNSGECKLVVSDITSSSVDFVVPQVLAYPIVINPGNSVQVPIRFQPTSIGPKAGVITIVNNDPITPNKTVNVSGTAPPGDIRVTGSTDFGEVCPGELAEKTVSICNVGRCDLNVASVEFVGACPDFTLVNNPFPAPISHDSCVDVVIRFTPTSCGPKTCTLRITSDDPDSPVINKTVTASTPCASIDVPPDVCFPAEVIQSVGACVNFKPFPISNTGNCPLKITNIALGGANPGAYTLVGLPSFPIILEQGHVVGEGDFNIGFAPTALARDTLASITVTYESDPVAGTTTQVTRTLNGEGVRTGARVLVTVGGAPLASVKKIQLHRLTANQNRIRLDSVDVVQNVPLSTVVPAFPCGQFQYHREYGTVSNPVQLAPGSYRLTVQAIVSGHVRSLTVGFDVTTCDFNPNIVVGF